MNPLNGQLSQNLTYKAIVVALPTSPLNVQITGEEPGIALAQQALSMAGPGGKPSLYISEVSQETAELCLLASGNVYRIMRPVDGRQLVVDIPHYTKEGAAQAIQRLEHIARWMQVKELSNPVSEINQAVKMEIYYQPALSALQSQEVQTVERIEVGENAAELELYYEYRNGKWVRPPFRIKLTNTGNSPLYCMLLDVTQTFAIQSGLLPGGGVWLRPGEEAWANQGRPIYGFVPEKLWQQGLSEIRDIVKLIVSTVECDATLLEQGELDVPLVTKTTRSLKVESTLNRLMRRIQTRNLSTTPENDEEYSDWATQEYTITTIRPQKSVSIPPSGRTIVLGQGIRLVGHPGLRAQAHLTTIPQASREAGTVILPPLLRDEPDLVQPFQFTADQAGGPGLSVLELYNIADYTVVTPEQPFVLQIDTQLAANEHLLPVGFDGEFFLPLGYAHASNAGTEIVLERLPTPENTRSLTGSVRILFQKIISERLETHYRYPLLTAVAFTADGTTIRIPDNVEVRKRVAAAQRILLYVHGIIGDTKAMAASAHAHGRKLPFQAPVPALADRYDLILTFDYENLKTPIEDTACTLKQRLEEVGLKAGHGKTLHVIAHSMGGLVTRWFIEREGGDAVVQHLVMLGTPNGGSPWSTIQNWVTVALGIGLNCLGMTVWPVHVLGGLLWIIETLDVTLDQMAPGSSVLNTLAASVDPHVPYTIIAGNTSIMQADAEQKRLARLLHRLTLQQLLHGMTALAFFGEPNDIAVSVQSITSVPRDRSPQPVMQQVNCDHLTYFSTETSLRTLVEALERVE